jgi:hypothetical protein
MRLPRTRDAVVVIREAKLKAKWKGNAAKEPLPPPYRLVSGGYDVVRSSRSGSSGSSTSTSSRSRSSGSRSRTSSEGGLLRQSRARSVPPSGSEKRHDGHEVDHHPDDRNRQVGRGGSGGGEGEGEGEGQGRGTETARGEGRGRPGSGERGSGRRGRGVSDAGRTTSASASPFQSGVSTVIGHNAGETGIYRSLDTRPLRSTDLTRHHRRLVSRGGSAGHDSGGGHDAVERRSLVRSTRMMAVREQDVDERNQHQHQYQHQYQHQKHPKETRRRDPEAKKKAKGRIWLWQSEIGDIPRPLTRFNAYLQEIIGAWWVRSNPRYEP